MNGRYLKWCVTAFLASVLCSLSYGVTADFERDSREIGKYPHRLVGTANGSAAAAYITKRLEEMAPDELLTQDFSVAQTQVIECEMLLPDGQKINLVPMRPNVVIPPVTDEAGVTGELIYVGHGTDADFKNANPHDKIAVMEYNAGTHWQRAFRLGAKAVVFVSSEKADASNFHYVRANANLPRFYYDGSRDALPDGTQVTIRSAIQWKRETGHNVLAFFKGTDPVFDLEKEEVIILAAPYDSFGEVPRRSPGGRAAINCAGLLKLAEYIKENRPRRHILIAFFDGEARNFSGTINFYWALDGEGNRATIADRLKAAKEEDAFIAKLEAQMNEANPLDDTISDEGRDLLFRLRNYAQDLSYAVRADLADARKALAVIPKDGDRSVATKRVADLDKEYQAWNALRKQLGRKDVKNLKDPNFLAIMSMLRDSVAARKKELTQLSAVLAGSEALQMLMKDKWITLHSTLMLGQSTDRWGLIVGGDSEMHAERDRPGLYGKVQSSFMRAYQSLEKTGGRPEHFEISSIDGKVRNPRLLWASPYLIHGGEVAGRYGIYNVVLGTVFERLELEGTPDDRVDQYDLTMMENNVDEIGHILTAVGSQDSKLTEPEAIADQEGLSLRRSMPVDATYIVPGFDNGRTTGAIVMGRQRGSSIPNTAQAGAVVQLSLRTPWNACFWYHTKPYAFEPYWVLLTDQNGAYEAGALPSEYPKPVGFAAKLDERGQVAMASDMTTRSTAMKRLNTFPCESGVLMLPPGYWPKPAKLLDARSNAILSDGSSERSYCETTDGLVYWYADSTIKGYKAFALRSIVALVNDPASVGTSRDDNYGVGYPVTTDWLSLLNARRSAGDLWRLNERRMNILRDRDIMNSSLEAAHGRVKDMIEEASTIDNAVRAEALSSAAYMSSEPVYEIIRTSMDDLVKAVLVLLALCVPFAFALERLLVGSTMIYKQVAWFTFFFVLTFLVLYMSHPAFAIAKTPVIIFLGFAIVVLSVLVIVIIMQKFEFELKAMQGMSTSVHASDISRINTMIAAMNMGISTMRRRPLRTALTAVTIILLTFTILGFASFDTQKGIVKLFTAPAPAYTGVELHQPNWTSFNPDFLDIINGRWSDDSVVSYRYWLCPEFPSDPDFAVAHSDATHPVILKGILGLSAAELSQREDLRELLKLENPEDVEDMVFMTDAVGDLLDVQPGAEVILKGLRLRVGEFVSASSLSAARDMDGSSILPVDFAQMKQSGSSDTSSMDDIMADQGSWASLPIDSIVITSERNARRLGGKPHIITLYTEDSQQSTTIAEDMARMMDKTPIVGTRRDGVYRHIQGTIVAASGIADLFFPILLGGLVIFGTMLGSVADREKEIYTFSALGLAPPHVASLFFSEALVYSVLGGLGGYLIAQGSMKVMSIAANYGLMQLPEMNYSSTNAIVTILIVMGTVMISAIYPAIKASKSANPGLLRSWKLPKPDNDEFDLIFPFTVSAYDLTGVVSFLKEHFDQFSDTGLGSFMSKNAKIDVYKDGALGMSATLALAPFDLGVTQEFALRSAKSEIEGIDEVNIRIVRLSGQPKDWARLNRVLLNDLRQQFLLWRSLPQATMEHYRSETLVHLKSTKVSK
ncbi:MAG: FtsX-like permease family protein [Spartobacteria bacterium]|nr:FtsX-like permease family protein [Spartobacteria bacterium]